MKFGQFRNNQGTPLHSSAYAKAANGDSMGVVSPQSFQERQRIEKNRRAIGRYGASSIAQPLGNHLQSELRKRLESPQEQDGDPDRKGKGHNRRGVVSRTYGGARETTASPGTSSAGSKLQVPTRKPSSFKEPPTRGFNPYG